MLPHLLASCSSEGGGWKVLEIDLTEETVLYTTSAYVKSVDGKGPKIALGIPSCVTESGGGGISSLSPMRLKGGRIYGTPSTGQIVEFDIDVSVNGEAAQWKADRSIDDEESLFFHDLQIVDVWRDASLFYLTLPTEQWDDLRYNFDMTGAREAIDQVCPRSSNDAL